MISCSIWKVIVSKLQNNSINKIHKNMNYSLYTVSEPIKFKWTELSNFIIQ